MQEFKYDFGLLKSIIQFDTKKIFLIFNRSFY